MFTVALHAFKTMGKETGKKSAVDYRLVESFISIKTTIELGQMRMAQEKWPENSSDLRKKV